MWQDVPMTKDADHEFDQEEPRTAQKMAAGKEMRKEVPRSAHAEWSAPADRPDPVAVLEAQAAQRMPDLVPIRYGRMLVSPGTFYRGGAGIMAWDLAHTPTTNMRVQCCGDAHLLNFGMYAAPDRTMVFDLNDFDETLPASFEWDLKRLVASVTIAARDNGLSKKEARDAAQATAARYQSRMTELAEMPFLEAWYDRLDVSTILDNINRNLSDKHVKRAEKTVSKAERKTNIGALHRYAEKTDAGFKIMNDPPVIVRISRDQVKIAQSLIDGAWDEFLSTLDPDRRVVIERYRRIDFARKVVGVGSVGTQAFMMLLMGDRDDDPLFIQFKEAQQSVLAPYAGASIYKQEGERVVQGQRIMQAASDPFLGWTIGPGKKKKHFYLRQLRDMKGSADVATMDGPRIAVYGALCGAVLARAHSRSGDAAMISGYLGTGSVFAESMAAFGDAYADQNELDFKALKAAEKSGRIKVESGV
jgi:uncharacterized protein (DUF2252 family)